MRRARFCRRNPTGNPRLGRRPPEWVIDAIAQGRTNILDRKTGILWKAWVEFEDSLTKFFSVQATKPYEGEGPVWSVSIPKAPGGYRMVYREDRVPPVANPRRESKYQRFKREWKEAGGYIGKDESLFRAAARGLIRRGLTGGEALKQYQKWQEEVTRLNPGKEDSGSNLYDLRRLIKEYGSTLVRTGREVVLAAPERAQQVYSLLVNRLAEYVAVLRRFPDDFGVVAESRPKGGLYSIRFDSAENAASFVSGVLGEATEGEFQWL